MSQSFCIYKLLKRSVQYPGIELLVPSSWQLQADHVAATPNTAELIELVKANPHSSYLLVVLKAEEQAVPELLSLEEGLKLALATEAFLNKR